MWRWCTSATSLQSFAGRNKSPNKLVRLATGSQRTDRWSKVAVRNLISAAKAPAETYSQSCERRERQSR
jgi:hypothetical protein